MKYVAASLGGASLAIIAVLASGIISIQILGVSIGAVFDLQNNLVAVSAHAVPWLQYLGLAALCTLVFMVINVWALGKGRALYLATSVPFVLVGGGLVGWALVLSFHAGPGVGGARGAIEGPLGWIQHGGNSPAMHVVLMLTVVWCLFRAQGGGVISTTGEATSTEGEYAEP